MKELSIEQKAQRYDEAIEIAKEINNEQRAQPFNVMTKVFPELAESEGERIRKAFIEHLTTFRDNYGRTKWYGDIKIDDAIAWLEKQCEQKLNGTFINADDVREEFMQEVYRILDADATNDRANQIIDAFDNLPTVAIEKQGEQKPIDKVEPKFKIEKDKWYVCIKDLLDNYANKAFCEGDTYLSTQDGSLIPSNSNVPFEVVCPDTYFRDWTIQDAKDGDVLYSLDSNRPFIYKVRNDYEQAVAYCGLNIYGKFFVWNAKDCVITLSNYVPATKEQRNTLKKAMADAGYEWDIEKKELKKIEKKPVE